MNTFKKIGAVIGLAGSIAGLGGGLAVANADAATAPTYHWYKINTSTGQTAERILYNAKYANGGVNKDIMYTHSRILRTINVKSNSDVFYYRATSPIAGGQVTDNGVAYNEWKAFPDEYRSIFVYDKESNPAANKYTYHMMIANGNLRNVIVNAQYTNAPKWID